jgi:very-short-patch-repair endonuclease
MMAAALYFKGDALVAGPAVAQHWGILDTTQCPAETEPVDVLYVGRTGKRHRGVRVHRTSSLARQDIRWRRGIPLTSPARTILDLAAVMGEMDLEAVLSAALGKNLVRRSNLADVMERNPHAKGIGKLRGLLQQTESLNDTRSRYERKLLALLKAAELPLPITNVPMGRRILDGLWPDLKLVYEFDGWLHHRDKFESDRVRDQQTLMAGLRTVRITRRQIDFGPYALIARLATIIATLRLAQEPSSQGPLAF